MKKLKGFTLVELIVVMAVFGIIMTGLMNIMQPITEASNTQRIANNQNRVQNSMISYIGENLRYSYDLAVVQGGTMKNAVDKFIAMEPVDENGVKIDFTAHPERKKEIQVICFDGYSDYQVGDAGADFHGRIVRTNNADPTTSTIDYSVLDSHAALTNKANPDGSSPLYLVLGKDYYSHADYFLSAKMTNETIELTIDSDYYYSPTKTRMISTDRNDDAKFMTTGRYELKNKGVGEFKYGMYKADGTELTTAASTSRAAATPQNNCIYFVFLTSYKKMDGVTGLGDTYGYFYGGTHEYAD